MSKIGSGCGHVCASCAESCKEPAFYEAKAVEKGEKTND